MNHLQLVATTLVAGAVVWGCGTAPNPLMGQGHTPVYVAGFNDGCESGKVSQSVVAGFYTKDTKRFDSDPQYAEGWTAGYQKSPTPNRRPTHSAGAVGSATRR